MLGSETIRKLSRYRTNRAQSRKKQFGEYRILFLSLFLFSSSSSSSYSFSCSSSSSSTSSPPLPHSFSSFFLSSFLLLSHITWCIIFGIQIINQASCNWPKIGIMLTKGQLYTRWQKLLKMNCFLCFKFKLFVIVYFSLSVL